jgi:DNA gyrase subunit B
MAKEHKFKSVELKFDDEHELYYVSFVNAQGAEHRLDWGLASTPEYRQMISKYNLIKEFAQAPYVIETHNGTGAPPAEELSDAEKADQEKAEKKNVKAAPKRRETATVEKNTLRELFEHVLNEGRKEYSIQRYKGLGEMTAEQLWQTTMDPERRTLLSVRLEDIAETENIFSTLMGEDVEARRKFIEENALDVKNLDI